MGFHNHFGDRYQALGRRAYSSNLEMCCRAGPLGQPSEQITAVNVAGTIIRVGALEEVRGKVQELIRLWSRPPPRVDARKEGGMDKGGRAAGGGSGADKFQKGQGRKRTRGDDLGGPAPKRLLRPRGGMVKPQGY